METSEVEYSTVGDLIVSNEYIESIQPQIPVSRVAEKFFSITSLDAIAIVDGRETIGLVTRPKLLLLSSRDSVSNFMGGNQS